jgi:4-hydroxy-tetrahydrodipicolinate reductase
MSKLRVIVAGATGWAGSGLAKGIAAADDLELVGAVARQGVGRPLGERLGDPRLTCAIAATAHDAITAARPDVLVEYTLPATARGNVMAALDAGADVVIGTSGLGDDDFAAIDARARAAGRRVLACGNFALTVVLLQKFAEMAARWVPSFEVIDYGKLSKPDAPSGTAGGVAPGRGGGRAPDTGVPLAALSGPPEARGASIAGVPVHSMRLPGFVSSVEVVFGLPDQRLHLRHESTSGAGPYVDGALLAIRKVGTLPPGLHRGLDRVMDL